MQCFSAYSDRFRFKAYKKQLHFISSDEFVQKVMNNKSDILFYGNWQKYWRAQKCFGLFCFVCIVDFNTLATHKSNTLDKCDNSRVPYLEKMTVKVIQCFSNDFW